MLKDDITIINKRGLHARAAAKLATTAARFGSVIQAGVNGKLVDSKSVMSLMLLAATQGTQLQLEVEGKDEAEALAAIRELIDDKFGEDE